MDHTVSCPFPSLFSHFLYRIHLNYGDTKQLLNVNDNVNVNENEFKEPDFETEPPDPQSFSTASAAAFQGRVETGLIPAKSRSPPEKANPPRLKDKASVSLQSNFW